MVKLSPAGYRRIVITIAIFSAFAVLNGAIAATGDINTYAGGSEEVSVFKIDNLSVPAGVVIDSSGTLFVNDGNRIKKVASSGTISVFVGTVSAGFANGSGVTARFNTPSSLALDSSNNIYVADTGNHRIRKVTPAGLVSTIAGTGTAGYSGDGGQAATAAFNRPTAVALDSTGNLFVADSFNKRIRKIDTSGVISTVAGNGCTQSAIVTCALGDGGLATDATLFVPNGVAVDSTGNLHISDTGHHRIRRIDGAGTITTTVGDGWTTNTPGVDGGYGRFGGDGGPATSASLNLPAGISFDSLGNLLIADTFNHRIRQVDSTGTITTVAGDGFGANSSGGRGRYAGDGGPATAASINSPNYAMRSGGNLYIADTMNHRLRKVDSAGVISTIAGTLVNSGCCVDDGLSPGEAKIGPRDILANGSGDVLIADTEAHRIVKISSSGVVSTIAGFGNAGYTGDGGAATSATLNLPIGLALDSGGNLYIGEFGNNRVRRISPQGTISTVAGNGLYGWYGDDGLAGNNVAFNGILDIAVDSSGNLYVVDAGNARIRMIVAGADGVVTGAADEIVSTVAGDGQFAFLPSSGSCYGPACSPLDLSWLSGFLADGGDPPFVIGDGGPATQASLYRPSGIALDAANNIYIADTGNNRIRKVTRSNGKIATVAGNGLGTPSAPPSSLILDGMAATQAILRGPTGVSVDNVGNIYIADTGNHRVRKVTFSTGVISTVAGSGTAGFQGDGGQATTARLRDPWTVAIKGGDLLIADRGNFRVRAVTGII